jgi:hypothetical protein
MNVAASTTQADQGTDKTITVVVNTKPVIFEEHKQTGLQIKTTAIAQGVAIQADFPLFEVHGPHNLQPIGDRELVTLHPHQEFRAVAPDDNS